MAPDRPDLNALARLVGGVVTGDGGIRINDVHHDSRAVTSGSLFVAIPGFTADGHDFVPRAEDQGAAGLVLEHEVPTDLPYVLVPDARAVLGVLAAAVHGHPATRLVTIGITGTNGKTTVAHLLEAIARAAGRRTGIVGTIGSRVGSSAIATVRTTPEASDLQRLLAGMADAGVGFVPLEVSSHALELGRVNGMRFDVAAFTNLSQDHLDFHGTMEEYYAAKRMLFEPERASRAVVCIDGPWGRRLAGETGLPVIPVGFDPSAAYRVSGYDPRSAGSRLTIAAGDEEIRVEFPLPGRFNARNAAVAAACAGEAGIGVDAIAAGLEEVGVVPGRFQQIRSSGITAVVDYAHTPEAITSVIEAAREMSDGEVIVVIGAGGDRDRAKRPAMGAAAAAADLVVITSDNPRHEDPQAIMAAVGDGAAAATGKVVAIEDRSTAIDHAVAAAHAGDVVLILGKGHEVGQQIGDRMVPFDDVEAATRALAAAHPS